MDALRRGHVGHRVVDELLDVVGPHPGRIDDDIGADRHFATRLQVDAGDTRDPTSLSRQTHRPGAGGDGGSLPCRSPRQRDHEPGIVGAGVVVTQPADECCGVQRGERLQHRSTRQLSLSRQRVGGGSSKGVIHGNAGGDVGAFPHPMPERIDERHRVHEVGRQLGEE